MIPTENYYWNNTGGPNGTGGFEKGTSVGGAASVATKSGNGQRIKGRFAKLDNASGIKIVNFAAGSNISILHIYAVPIAGTAALAGDEQVLIAIDPYDLAAATSVLTQVESLDNDISWIPIPVNKWEKIDLSANLVNGTFSGGCVALKTVGGIALDVYVGGQ